MGRQSYLLTGIAGLFLFTFLSCKDKGDEELPKKVSHARTAIAITHTFGDSMLRLTACYPEPVNDTVCIHTCTYYLSNFALIDTAGELVAIPESYALIDESKEASKLLQWQISSGVYTGIRFLTGVDSIRNVSGVQSGALDPANGMFWTWASGYIQAKLEGFYTTGGVRGEFIHHIGGFADPYNAVLPVTFTFDQPLTVKEGETLQLDVSVDFANWFSVPNAIILANQKVIVDVNSQSAAVAMNKLDMFRLIDTKVIR